MHYNILGYSVTLVSRDTQTERMFMYNKHGLCISIYMYNNTRDHVPTCTYMQVCYLSPNKTVLYIKYICTSSCIINMACVSLYIIIHMRSCIINMACVSLYIHEVMYMQVCYLSPNKTVLYIKYICISSCIINMACVSLYIIIHTRSCTYMYMYMYLVHTQVCCISKLFFVRLYTNNNKY